MKEIQEGFEPYIPSVHLKNIAPYDWLKTDDAQDFLRKLEQYQLEKETSIIELLRDLLKRKFIKSFEKVDESGKKFLITFE